MPTYVYRCADCGHEFEIFHKSIPSRPRARKCPVCGGKARTRITGGAGFLFKGEGFHTTDYRSQEYRSKAKAEKEPAADTGKDAAADKKKKAPQDPGKSSEKG